MALSSFANQFGVQPEPSSAHTVGGYVFERLDRLPQVGESIPLGNYLLRVEELDQRRIARLGVERKGEAGEPVLLPSGPL
jgi:putative hemolysin